MARPTATQLPIEVIPLDIVTGLPATVAGRAVSTASITTVAFASQVSTKLLDPTDRNGLIVYNGSTQPANIKYGTGASGTSLTDVIQPGQTWYMGQDPVYRGAVYAYWPAASGSGNLNLTEL